MIRAFTAFLIVFLFVISSCSPKPTADITAALTDNPPMVSLSQTSTTTQTYATSQTSTRTQTQPLTETPALTPTQSPTATIFPGLQSTGPFFLLEKESYSELTYTFIDVNGSNQWTINLPMKKLSDFEYQHGNISPDWRWYAYVTGIIERSGEYPEGGIILHVQNLLSGEIQDIMDLAPMDISNRLDRWVKQTGPEYCQSEANHCFDWGVSLSNDSFSWNAWSPDGKYLAFGAMLDGDSTDIYVVNMDTGKINRLESGLGIVYSLHWSPDGQWIIYEDIGLSDTNGPWPYRYTWHAVRTNGTGLKKLPGPYQFLQWFSDYEYMVYNFLPTAMYWDLTAVNIQTGNSYTIYRGDFLIVQVDAKSRLIMLFDEQNKKYYFGNIYGNLNQIDIFGFARGGTVHPFLDYDQENQQWLGITFDGKIEKLDWRGHWSRDISDNYWFALSDGNTITAYDPADRERFRLSDIHEASSLTWDTNAQGLFFLTQGAYFYWRLTEPSAWRLAAPVDRKDITKTFFAPLFIMKSLPHLRILPTRAAKPAEGTSIWSQTKYKELFQPGINRYSVSIPADSSWRWSFSLGTTDPDLFEKILLPEDVEFRINGEWIDTNMFRMTDKTAEGRFSRAWAAMLSGWRSGDRAELEIKYTLREAVRDGNVEYPAGEYRQIISVVVD